MFLSLSRSLYWMLSLFLSITIEPLRLFSLASSIEFSNVEGTSLFLDLENWDFGVNIETEFSLRHGWMEASLALATRLAFLSLTALFRSMK